MSDLARLLTSPIETWTAWAVTMLLLVLALGSVGLAFDKVGGAVTIGVVIAIALAVKVALVQRRAR